MMNPNYTVQQAADLLGISVPSVYSYERRGFIKRVEDPHRLQGKIRYRKETVDQLVKEKEQLETSGRSISDFAKQLGVNNVKVTDAIKTLNLDVKKVPSHLKSSKLRYALTPEQEKEIAAYINRQKTTRAKRNHLYFPSVDLALYQSFLIAGEQPVRLIQNEEKELGFQLDSETFVSYMEAIRSLDIEPRYSIHKDKQRAQLGFTDFTVPTGKKAFYQILDALYTVCGVENFNAYFQRGNLVIAVRNGQYASDYAPAAALQALKEYSVSGDIEVSEGVWHFNKTVKTIQLEVPTRSYHAYKKEADKQKLSVKDWIHQVLQEKERELKNYEN